MADGSLSADGRFCGAVDDDTGFLNWVDDVMLGVRQR